MHICGNWWHWYQHKVPPQNWTFNWINHSIIRIARLLSSLGFDFQHMSHLLFIKEKEDIIFCFAQAVNVFISHYFHFFPQCRICVMFDWKGPKQMLHFIDLAFSIYNLDIKIDLSKFIHKFFTKPFCAFEPHDKYCILKF